MYFNYHAKVKKLLLQGHAVGYEMLENYHQISPCLLIYFDDGRAMPIRENMFAEYFFLLAKYGVYEIDKQETARKK